MSTVPHSPALLWYVGIYAVGMTLIGMWYSKGLKTSDDFVLAGRNLGSFVLIGTLIATWCGSGTVTGGGNSRAYMFGPWNAMVGIPVTILAVYLMYVIAPAVREHGKYTVAELLETKYGPTARVLAAIIVLLAYVGITSYQYKGLAFVLNVTTGMSVELGTILSAALMIFLAMAGGLKSVAFTDALSAVMMLAGLILAVPYSIKAAGGWGTLTSSVPPSMNTLTGGQTWLQLAGFVLPGVVLQIGDQNMYQRLAASRGNKESKTAMIGWLVGLLIISPTVALIAFAARGIFPGINPGMALISTTVVMPQFVGGLLLASSAAFIITTGDSYLLSCATNVTYDIYVQHINPKATDKQKFFMTRVMCLVLGLLAFVVLQFFPTILAAQMYAYTIYGAGLTPAILAVFFWKKVTKAGGISSMIVGVVTTLWWEIAKPMDFNSVLVSVPAAVLALILVSLATQNSIEKEVAA